MKFELEGLSVFFPYDHLYKEQYEYMLELKHALDAKGHGLLEMPTGTGKTVCLVSLITSYQYAHPECGKLIYCTRTVPEMMKCMEEVQRVIDCRVKHLGLDGGKVLAVCQSSRRNMCIHERIQEENDRDSVDSACRGLTASWVRENAAKNSDVELCSYFEKYDELKELGKLPIPTGVFSLNAIKKYAGDLGVCPYFLTRYLTQHANILVFNYQYLLDPKVAGLMSDNLAESSIIVFDEAHNIDNVCIEAFSVDINRESLDASSRCVNSLQSKVTELKAVNSERLQQEYSSLVNGLIERGVLQQDVNRPNDALMANPLLPDDVLNEAVPGSIRRAEHFIVFLKRIIEFLKTKMKGTTVQKDTPLALLRQFFDSAAIERKPLRFAYSRLNSLLRTLQITAIEEFLPLQDIANFATLVSTYVDGFAIIREPEASTGLGFTEPVLQLCCLDASLALKPVLEKYSSVIITSGTLSPLDLYPKILDFHPVVAKSFPMSTFRPCLLPLIITRGTDQTALTTRFSERKDVSVIRNYGQLLLDICSSVPDGVCCFFTSYQFMEYVIAQWDAMRIIHRIMEVKLIYIETKDVVETTLALDNYKRACDCGRGAVFLSVARGKVAEGIDFDKHYGRCVVLMGVPYRYTQSYPLLSRLDYMRSHFGVHENDFLTFDAMRQAAQCVGRVIRNKTDYGIVVLADSRFNKNSKRSRLPPWVSSFLSDMNLNLSSDIAIEQIKRYLRLMGQPVDTVTLNSILLSEEQLGEGKSD